MRVPWSIEAEDALLAATERWIEAMDRWERKTQTRMAVLNPTGSSGGRGSSRRRPQVMKYEIEYWVTERLRAEKGLKGLSTDTRCVVEVPEEYSKRIMSWLQDILSVGHAIPATYLKISDSVYTLRIPSRRITSWTICEEYMGGLYANRCWTQPPESEIGRIVWQMRDSHIIEDTISYIMSNRDGFIDEHGEVLPKIDNESMDVLLDLWRDCTVTAIMGRQRFIDERFTEEEIRKILKRKDEQYQSITAETLANLERIRREQEEKVEWEKREQEKVAATAKRYTNERNRWCKEHGSTYLNKCLEQGYDVDQLYIQERVALELPGFVPVDGELNETLRDTFCRVPLPCAEKWLDLTAELRAAGHNALIVSAKLSLDDDMELCGEMSACGIDMRGTMDKFNHWREVSCYAIKIDDWPIPESDGTLDLYHIL